MAIALTPTEARELWLALIDNAAHLVVDADALYPSPRTLPLLILAYEELGKSLWISEVFHVPWGTSDDTALEVPNLEAYGHRHRQKLMPFIHYTEDAAEHVRQFELVRGRPQVVLHNHLNHLDPHRYATYVTEAALEDDQAKQRGFYVDISDNGVISKPREDDPGELAVRLWVAADVICGILEMDQMNASLQGRRDGRDERTQEIMDTVQPVLM